MSLNPAGYGDRELVERAATLIQAALPPGWTHLHVECAPSGEVQAFWIGADPSAVQPVPVPPQAAADLYAYLTRAVTGSGLQQLIVDVHADGGLSVRTAAAPPARSGAWLKRSLLGVSVVCSAAAAIVFAFGWRWSAPPAANADPLPTPSANQQQAFDVIDHWLQALNTRDTAAVQQLSCRNPDGSVAT
ncbi:MAG: hypothetical protein ACRDUB_10870, partial [Mycobacterium sp.]